MMVPIEGQLEIDLYPGDDSAAGVEVRSSRPLGASRIMIGKKPEQVLSLLPLMFNVCGVAQARAALLAMQRELGIELRPEQETARDMLVLVECARENLLRIFLDWPSLFDVAQSGRDLQMIGELNRTFAGALFSEGRGFALDSILKADQIELEQAIGGLDRYLEQQVFSDSPGDWLQLDTLADLENWVRRCDSIAARSLGLIIERQWGACARAACPQLPQLDPAELLQRFASADAERFIAFPEWRGSCRETTVYCRQQHKPLIRSLETLFGRSLITRWVARLVELASIPAQLRELGTNLLGGSTEATETGAVPAGLAQVEAARGRLIHRVQVEQGIVSNYQILAPTEWNFHPRGVIRESLEDIAVNEPSEREKLARIVISAIDPCVGYQLRIH